MASSKFSLRTCETYSGSNRIDRSIAPRLVTPGGCEPARQLLGRGRWDAARCAVQGSTSSRHARGRFACRACTSSRISWSRRATSSDTVSPGLYCSSRLSSRSARTRKSSIARISSSTLRPAVVGRRVAAHLRDDQAAGVVARRRRPATAPAGRAGADRPEAQAERVERLARSRARAVPSTAASQNAVRLDARHLLGDRPELLGREAARRPSTAGTRRASRRRGSWRRWSPCGSCASSRKPSTAPFV